jgi:hypothetical protein
MNHNVKPTKLNVLKIKIDMLFGLSMDPSYKDFMSLFFSGVDLQKKVL